MLPFLLKKRQNPTLMMQAKSDGGMEMEMESEENHGLLAAAADLLAAIEAKDVKAIAMAWQAGYDMCEMSEGEMESDG